MGLLDDAIREHLDLKRRRGADPSEVERAEHEALGPVRRGPENQSALQHDDDLVAEHEVADPASAVEDWAEPAHSEAEAEEWAHEPVADAPEPRTSLRERFSLRGRRSSEPEPADDPLDHDHLDDHVGSTPYHDEVELEDQHEEPPAPPPAAPIEAEPLEPVEPPPPVAGTPRRVRETEDLAAHEPPGAPTSPRSADAEPRLPRAADPPPTPASPPSAQPPPGGGETVEYDVQEALGGHPPAQPPRDDDVLEETPEFLQDTPDHDRLWFEQRPPKDFDFDG